MYGVVWVSGHLFHVWNIFWVSASGKHRFITASCGLSNNSAAFTSKRHYFLCTQHTMLWFVSVGTGWVERNPLPSSLVDAPVSGRQGTRHHEGFTFSSCISLLSFADKLYSSVFHTFHYTFHARASFCILFSIAFCKRVGILLPLLSPSTADRYSFVKSKGTELKYSFSSSSLIL